MTTKGRRPPSPRRPPRRPRLGRQRQRSSPGRRPRTFSSRLLSSDCQTRRIRWQPRRCLTRRTIRSCRRGRSLPRTRWRSQAARRRRRRPCTRTCFAQSTAQWPPWVARGSRWPRPPYCTTSSSTRSFKAHPRPRRPLRCPRRRQHCRSCRLRASQRRPHRHPRRHRPCTSTVRRRSRLLRPSPLRSRLRCPARPPPSSKSATLNHQPLGPSTRTPAPSTCRRRRAPAPRPSQRAAFARATGGAGLWTRGVSWTKPQVSLPPLLPRPPRPPRRHLRRRLRCRRRRRRRRRRPQRRRRLGALTKQDRPFSRRRRHRRAARGRARLRRAAPRRHAAPPSSRARWAELC